jgi:hypothetical protein
MNLLKLSASIALFLGLLFPNHVWSAEISQSDEYALFSEISHYEAISEDVSDAFESQPEFFLVEMEKLNNIKAISETPERAEGHENNFSY